MVYLFLEKFVKRRLHSIFTFFILYLYIFNYRVEHFHDWIRSPRSDGFYSKGGGQVDLDAVFFKSNGSTKQVCNIPQLQPFTDLVQKYYNKSHGFQSCDKIYPLLFNSTLDGKIVPAKSSAEFFKMGIVSCCYKVITIGKSDNNFDILKECHPISLENDTRIPSNHEFIAVKCQKQSKIKISFRKGFLMKPTNKKQEKFYDMHAFVHPKGNLDLNLTNQSSNNPSSGKDAPKVNVIVFGLDAHSRMNFLRAMPKSYAYLTKVLGAVDMQGYNKVEDNTFPNLMPMLTSFSASKIGSTCGVGKAYDSCPFIWKLFKKHGYSTSFSEDASSISIFNFERNGFKQPPTDYYLRAFGLAADKTISSQSQISAKLCYGPRLTFQILLDYVKKLMFQMRKLNKPFFQFTWATALTHDYLNVAEMGDIHLLEALQWMKNEGYLNNTVLVLMSDHGHRVDDFRNTFQGQLEDRLPFMILQIPDWMRQKYSKAYQNLLGNVNKLVTTFDLHQVLRDVLRPMRLENYIIARREKTLLKTEAHGKLLNGISLFLPITKNRTCEMAGVKKNYCSCNYLKETRTTTDAVKKAASAAVKAINEIVKPYSNCSKLSLDTVKMAQVAGEANRDFQGYLLNFQTNPGGAMFEALVSKSKKMRHWNVTGTISRTNLYGNQSHCVHDSVIKLYCYCSDQVKLDKNTSNSTGVQ